MIVWTNSRSVMAAPCYCCPPPKGKMQISETLPMEIDLDVALHELGMLSTITNSRKEYLREKCRQDKHAFIAHDDDSLCVVQMNSKFVTNFSFSKSSAEGVKSDSQEPLEDPCFPEKKKCHTLSLRKLSRKLRYDRRYLYKPYDFALQTKFDKPLAVNTSLASPVLQEAVVITGLTRQDSGNKSNPGSPVKSQKIASNAGCSIFRSRSLDDLEFGKLNLSDGCSSEAGRAEIDTVSQRISKLHVS